MVLCDWKPYKNTVIPCWKSILFWTDKLLHSNWPLSACILKLLILFSLQEDAEVFQAAMRETGEAFIQAAEWVLLPANAAQLGFGGDLEEYAQFLCTSAGIWGVSHLHNLAEDRRNTFLHLVSPITPSQMQETTEVSLEGCNRKVFWMPLSSLSRQRSSRSETSAFACLCARILAPLTKSMQVLLSYGRGHPHKECGSGSMFCAMQALRFMQSEYSQLVHRALPAWVGLLTAAEKAQRGQQEAVSLPLECVAALLDVAGSLSDKRILRTRCSDVDICGCLCSPYLMPVTYPWSQLLNSC